MTQLEVIEALQAGKDILETMKEGQNYRVKYRIKNGQLQISCMDKDSEYRASNFKDLFGGVAFSYSIYEEKPKLKWDGHYENSCYCSDIGNYQVRVYKDAVVGYKVVHPATYAKDLFLGSFNDIIMAKEACQKHFERNS